MPTSNSMIGKNVVWWHKDSLINIYDSKIGEDTKIGNFVEIGKCVIGNNCSISSHCFLCEGVVLEDDVFVGPNVTFTNVLTPRAFINRKNELKPTLIKKGASIGAGAIIICGNIIGEYAMIGAGSVITKSVPDYALVYGNPAKVQGSVFKEGYVRR